MPKRTSYKQIITENLLKKKTLNFDLAKHQREILYTPKATTLVNIYTTDGGSKTSSNLSLGVGRLLGGMGNLPKSHDPRPNYSKI